MKYKELTRFKYNDKIFTMLLNSDGIRYFMEVLNNGHLDYPELKDFIYLSKKYNSINRFKYKFKSFYNGDIKVKIKNQVVSLALASLVMFSSSSCLNDKQKDNYDETISMFQKKEYDGLSLEKVDYSSNIFLVKSIDISKLDSKDFLIDPSYCYDYSYNDIVSPNEVGNYLNKTGVTSEELISLIYNLECSSFIKETLIDGIKNIENSRININKDVLYYNLQNLKIVYFDEVKDSRKSDCEMGMFDAYTHTVFLDRKYNSENKDIICHEILGHGSCNLFIDESKIKCCISPRFFITDIDGRISQACDFGSSFEEGYCDIISSFATNSLVDTEKSSYGLFVYGGLTILKMSDISINEYANIGALGLLKRDSQNFSFVDKLNAISSFDTLYLMVVNEESFALDYTDDMINCYDKYITNMINRGCTIDEISDKVYQTEYVYVPFIKLSLLRNSNPIIFSQSSENSFVMLVPEVIDKRVSEIIHSHNTNKEKLR